MKLTGKYRVRKVGGTYIVVKLGAGQDVNLSQLITLNETGAFIFNKIADEISMDDLVSAITEEYDIDSQSALEAAETYVNKLAELGIAER